MRHRCGRQIAIILGAAALTMPSAAAAQDGGVHVDPGSPSGKEYAIPLEQARRDATGVSDTIGSSSNGTDQAPVPLFGEGIGDSSGATNADGTPGGGRSASAVGASTGRTGAGQQRTDKDTGGTSVATALQRTAPVAAATSTGEGGGVLTVGAVAVAVLLLGSVLGSIARRRSDG